MEGEVMRGIKNPNVDIKKDGNDVVVTDGKTEYFRKPKTEQTVAIANTVYFAEKYAEVQIMDNRINFTQEELQLIYAACMSYGNKLSEIVKSIPNELFAINGLGHMHGLADRAKDSWNLARKITEYMEGR